MAMYGIMRYEKRKATQLFPIMRENNRTLDAHKKGLNFINSDIEWGRTSENIFFRKSDNWLRSVLDQVAEVGLRTPRKNAVYAIDCVYSASPPFYATMDLQNIKKWCYDCLDFHKKDFCGGDDARIINAVLHLDEKTPHLHVISVPIYKDDRGYHLSARDICGGPKEAHLHQNRFYENVSQKWGLERGEMIYDDLTGERILVADPHQLKKHMTKREWQIETQQDRLTQLQDALEREQIRFAQTKAYADNQEKRKHDLIKVLAQLEDTYTRQKQIAEKIRIELEGLQRDKISISKEINLLIDEQDQLINENYSLAQEIIEQDRYDLTR